MSVSGTVTCVVLEVNVNILEGGGIMFRYIQDCKMS
jgi:hypothetical protein